MPKTKWIPEGALRIAEKRREVKNKGEKERHTLLNAEIGKTSSVISAKKSRKTTECERLEFSSRIRDTKGIFRASLVAQSLKRLPAMRET